MSDIQLNPKIKKAQALSQDAIYKLNNFQTGVDKIVKSGRDYIDKHIKGLLPSDLITIFAPSGIGKTEEFCKIFSNFLNEKINPDAKGYVSLEFNLEMLYFNLFLRNAAKQLDKKKSDVLFKEFTPEEKTVIQEYHLALADNRRFIVEESVTTKEFYQMTSDFCEINKSKKGIFIGIDHCKLILPSEKGEDPLEALTTYINILRKKYNNLYFVLLSQVNRTYYATEPKERSNNNLPTTSMIYGASHFEFLSSYIVAIVNPFKTFGIREYMKIKTDRYPDLTEFTTSEDKNGFTSFDAVGKLFYHILKLRDSDHMFDTLHIEELDISKEQMNKMKQSIEDKTFNGTPLFNKTPIFDSLPTQTVVPEFKEKPLPNLTPAQAFGDGTEPF